MNKVAIGGVFMLLCLLFSVGYLIGFNNLQNNLNNLPQTGTDNIPTPTPQKLWGNLKTNEPEPKLLSQEEYLNIYLNTIQAIKDRNFDEFKELISSQRLWRLNYHQTGYLPFENGMPIIKVDKVDQRQNFYNFSLANVINYVPPTNLVVVDRLAYDFNNITDNVPMKYYNPEQDIDILIDQTGYKYKVSLFSHAKNYQFFAQPETGEIIFVYEDGKWKYDWQLWFDKNINLDFINYKIDFGDFTENYKEIVLNLDAAFENNNFVIDTVTINKGQTVKWSNTHGVIQSYMDSNDDLNWYSPFLNEGGFYRQFLESGIFKYQIIHADNIYSGEIEVL